jgi:hypothetical protein
MKSLLDFFKSRQPATDATGRTRPAAEAEVAKPKVASGPLFLRRRLRFSVGVDFGTTSTKAAYLVMGEAGRRTRPIFFDHGLREYPDFCEPSVGLIHKGRLLWGAVAARALADKPWATGLRRLKVLLAGEHDPSFRDDKLLTYHQLYIEACGLEPAQYSIEALTAAVFATQLANLRAILEDLHPGQVEDAMYNVCVPIEQVENSLVLASYHRVIDVAQRLLRADGSLAVPPGDLLAAANEKLPTARSIEWSEGRVFAVPEAVAQNRLN